MAPRKLLTILFMAVQIAGCIELTAERPLFLAEDQGPPPLQEGVWIAVGEGCPEHNLRRRRFPSECAPLDIRRQEDGAWRVAFRTDLVSDFTASDRAEREADPANGPYRVVLAPAVERDTGNNYAPLYLGEITRISDQDGSIAYAVAAPMGAMPAAEMRVILLISCASILRDGPIEGVTANYETNTDPSGLPTEVLGSCVASSQAGVREAARRALIENLNELTERRFVLVRAN